MDTIDNFIDWFSERLRDFVEWFIDTVRRACGLLLDIVVWVITIFIVILLFPLWILPFIYWWFFVKMKKEVENE